MKINKYNLRVPTEKEFIKIKKAMHYIPFFIVHFYRYEDNWMGSLNYIWVPKMIVFCSMDLQTLSGFHDLPEEFGLFENFYVNHYLDGTQYIISIKDLWHVPSGKFVRDLIIKNKIDMNSESILNYFVENYRLASIIELIERFGENWNAGLPDSGKAYVQIEKLPLSFFKDIGLKEYSYLQSIGIKFNYEKSDWIIHDNFFVNIKSGKFYYDEKATIGNTMTDTGINYADKITVLASGSDKDIDKKEHEELHNIILTSKRKAPTIVSAPTIVGHVVKKG
jgi:hypothetical protein